MSPGLWPILFISLKGYVTLKLHFLKPMIMLRDVLPGLENLYNQLLFVQKTLTLDSSAHDFLGEMF